MRHTPVPALIASLFPAAVLVFALALRPALADEPDQAPASAELVYTTAGGASPRGKAEDWLIMPAGLLTATGTLTFMTADGGLRPEETVKFTDVVFFALAGRYSIKGRAELALGVTLLPKQPSYTDESPWQGTHLGGRVGFGKRYAGWLHLAGGPLLSTASGYWANTELGIEAKKSIDPSVVFQGGLGGTFTALLYDQATDESFWMSELAVDGEMIFRAPRGEVAFWLGTQFRFPLVKNPGPSAPDPASGLFMDPQTRVNFYLGFVLSAIPAWDIFIQYVFVDRGDLINPPTTLPILSGGFDQGHLIFGLTRRFKQSPPQAPTLILAR